MSKGMGKRLPCKEHFWALGWGRSDMFYELERGLSYQYSYRRGVWQELRRRTGGEVT